MNKKADINQVFIYLVSILIVAFIGFLVIQFVSTFSSDTQARADSQFYSTFEKVHERTAQQWNSEKIQEFRVSQEVEHICFLTPQCDEEDLDIDEALKHFIPTLIDGGDNVIMFSQDDIINSRSMPSFNLEEDCTCIQTVDRRISLLFENNRNQVYISEFNQ